MSSRAGKERRALRKLTLWIGNAAVLPIELALAVKGCSNAVLAASAPAYEPAPAVKCPTNCS
jgi:hypothetical protein